MFSSYYSAVNRCVLLLCILLCSSIFVYSQNIKQNNKFDIAVFQTFGFGRIDNEFAPNYNLNSRATELLFNYRLVKNQGVAIGIGYSDLGGNGFNTKGNFFHEREILTIPLMYTLTKSRNNFKFFLGIGVEGMKIMNDKYKYLNEVKKKQFGDWGVGAKTLIGFFYGIDENISVGVVYNGNADLTKLRSNDEKYFKGKQYLEFNNKVGIGINFHF